jgi:hypothetical protein
VLIAQRIFRREHNVVALLGNEFAQHRFRLAELILIGGIDEVSPGLAVATVDGLRLVAVGAVAPTFAKIPGPQRQ